MPSLVITPSTSTRPATLDADITGLTSGTRINLRVDGSVVMTGRVGSTGDIHKVGVAIGAASTLGSHTAEVFDSSNKTRLMPPTTFTIVAAAPTPTPPPTTAPKAQISQDAGPSGTTTVMSLTGFAGGSSGPVAFDGSTAGMPTYTIAANGTGSVTVVVPLSASVADHTITTLNGSGAVLTTKIFTVTSTQPPVEPPPPPPPATGLPAIVGFGKNALSTLPTTGVVVVGTVAEFMTAFGNLGNSVHTIKFTPNATLALPLPLQVNRIDGRSNFFIDGRGSNVTFSGGPLWFEGCSFFAICNIRHRGGWTGGQSADDITFAGSTHDAATINVSVSGASDEGHSTTRSSYNISYQDEVFGPGVSNHNFGSLNDYLSDRISFIRPVFVGLEYRCPKVGYYGDASTGALPANCTADVVNRIDVDCLYGLTVSSSARVNDTNPYTQNVTNSREVITDGHLGVAVPAWAQVTAMTPTDAARYAKVNGGCLPHDSFDQGLLNRITA